MSLKTVGIVFKTKRETWEILTALLLRDNLKMIENKSQNQSIPLSRFIISHTGNLGSTCHLLDDMFIMTRSAEMKPVF